MRTSEKERRSILRAVETLVTTKMINMGRVDLKEWSRRVDARTPELLIVDEPVFESSVRELLSELCVSHTAFYKSLPDRFPPQHTISATLRNIGDVDHPNWMFLDVFDGGPADTAGIRPGDYLEAVDAKPVEGLLPTFGIGRRHNLTINARDGRRSTSVEVPVRKGSKTNPPIVEPLALKSSVCAPGVGYLKVGWFPGAIGLRFANELDRTIANLTAQGTTHLIVDLRGNIGGGLGFARLASYFCADKRPIGQSLTPTRLKTGYDPAELPRIPLPDSKLKLALVLIQFLLKDKSLFLLSQGLGTQPFHGRIAILVNEWTNSAAEMLANFASEYGLGTIIGTKTAGNILGARNFEVGRDYWVRLPVFGWLTAAGESLDGRGLDPDQVVDVDPESMRAGRDVQVEQAVEKLIQRSVSTEA